MNINSTKFDILNMIDYKTDNLLSSTDSLLTIQDQIGLCLMSAYKYKYIQKEIYFERMNVFFNNILNIQSYQNADIIQGASAILSLIKILREIGILDYSNNHLMPIEQTISNELTKSLLKNNWDYYHGAIGYALALDKPKYYKLLIDYFIRNIKKDDHGSYYLLSEFYYESTNLGLPAGILGVLSMTNSLILKGLFVDDSKEIQKKLLEIIFNKIKKINSKCYPALIERDYPAKMCWAYGELTLAAQLFVSGILNSENWLLYEANKIALMAIKRNSLNNTYILDSCIINGSIGNYLLYNFISKIQPNHFFSNSEQNWLNITANLLNETDYHNIDKYTGNRMINLSVLNGLSGIYLSVANFDSIWQEYILLPDINRNNISYIK